MRTYLPNLPLASLQVESTEYEGKQILVIGIGFYDSGAIKYCAVAAQVSTKLIDFEISW